MKKLLTPQSFLLVIILFLNITVSAQFNADNSNPMVAVLGKEANSPEIEELKTTYKVEAINDAHFRSNSGVELLLTNGKVHDVRLFNKSTAFGDFKGKLPNGLLFGMSSAGVKNKLGKPVTSYNNGYTEFEFPAYIISCWFEGGMLSQVELTAR